MTNRILLILIVLSAGLASCVTDPRPSNDCDLTPCNEACPESRAYRTNIEPLEMTLRPGEEGTVSIHLNPYCGYSIWLWAVDKPVGTDSAFTLTLQLGELPEGDARYLIIRNNSASEGTYIVNLHLKGRVVDQWVRPITINVPGGPAEPCAPWSRVTGLPDNMSFNDVDAIPNSETFFLAAELDGATVIHRSVDEGMTWVPLPSEPIVAGTVAGIIDFTSELYGVAVMKGGSFGDVLMQTTDGGSSWRRIDSYGTSGLGLGVRSLHVGGPGRIYIVPTAGSSIGISTDYGETWTWSDVGSGGLSDVAAPSANRIVVSHDGGLSPVGASFSSDGGNTWLQSVTPVSNYQWIEFFTEDYGIAGGSALSRTLDGGATWLSVPAPTPGVVMVSGSAQVGQTGGLVGTATAVGTQLWETVDNGNSWRKVCQVPAFDGAWTDVANSSNGSAVAIGSRSVYRRGEP